MYLNTRVKKKSELIINRTDQVIFRKKKPNQNVLKIDISSQIKTQQKIEAAATPH